MKRQAIHAELFGYFVIRDILANGVGKSAYIQPRTTPFRDTKLLQDYLAIRISTATTGHTK